MEMSIEDFKDIMTVNDIAFDYQGKEYYIFQGTNCCVVGDYASDESQTFDKFEDLDANLDDTLNHWMVEGKPLKEIIKDIVLH